MRDWTARPQESIPVWRAPRTSAQRTYIAVVELVGISLMVAAIVASWPGLLASWGTIVLVTASLMVVSPFVLRLTTGRDPVFLGVNASILAFIDVGHPSALTLAIWACSAVAYQCMLRRPLKVTLLLTGTLAISSAMLLSSVAVLGSFGIPTVLSYPLAVGVYLLVHTGLVRINQQLHRTRATDATGSRMRWKRWGMLWSVNAVIAWVGIGTQAFSARGLALPGTSMSAFSVASLAVVALVVHSLTLRLRLRQISLKMNVVLDAAHELPWQDGPHPVERVGILAAVAVPGHKVSVQPEPAGPNQIDARIDFPDGHSEYVVVTRSTAHGAFSRLEERVLSGLAHMASTTMHVDHGMRRLEARAATDELTGLSNYRAFLEALPRAGDVPAEAGGVAILYIDVDGLKAVNDEHGHEVGNELLVEVARRMRSALRDGDTIARVGGDEFAVILANGINAKDAENIRQRVGHEIGRPLWLAGRLIAPSASVGIAHSPAADAKIGELVIASDRDMYKRKMAKQGVIGVEGESFFGPMAESALADTAGHTGTAAGRAR